MLQTYRQQKNDAVMGLIFTAMTLLPLSTVYNYVRVGLMMVLCVYVFSTKGMVAPHLLKIGVCMLISPLIPTVAVLLFEQTFSGVVIHEYMRMVFVVAAIFVAGQCRLSFRTVYILTAGVLLFNFIIQLMQRSGSTEIYTFIRNNYTETDGWTHLDLMNEEGGGFRAGSIFLNPNVYMVIPLTSLGVFYQQKRMRDFLVNKILIVCALVSCYLTGSRTSVAVSAVIIVVYYFKFDRRRLWLAAIAAAALVIWMNVSGYLEARAFEFSDIGSFFIKLNGFVWYWQSANPIYWITGSLGSQTVSYIDCEWGHLYSWYGVFGMYWYILYYKAIKRQNEHLPVFSAVLVLAMMLTAVSASVLLVMQIFPFVCMLAFAHIEQEQEMPYEIRGVL